MSSTRLAPASLLAGIMVLFLSCAPSGEDYFTEGETLDAAPTAPQDPTLSPLSLACADAAPAFRDLRSTLADDVTEESLGRDARQLAMMAGILAAHIDRLRAAAGPGDAATTWIGLIESATQQLITAVRAAGRSEFTAYLDHRERGLNLLRKAAAATPEGARTECDF